SKRSPENSKYELVKRVIAVEGDLVQTLPPYPTPQARVPQGHLWVEGDAFHSQDSNTFGPVPSGLVDSRLIWLVWPIWRIGRPTHPMNAHTVARVIPVQSQK
ncbi:peptidase S24/S26A/S26B/S26C, partial [Favolaschia claudopus]